MEKSNKKKTLEEIIAGKGLKLIEQKPPKPAPKLKPSRIRFC